MTSKKELLHKTELFNKTELLSVDDALAALKNLAEQYYIQKHSITHQHSESSDNQQLHNQQISNQHTATPAEEIQTQVTQHSNSVLTVPLSAALNHISAQNIYSNIDIPPNNNSAMDGFAVNTQHLTGEPPYTLPISQYITAGMQPTMLQPHTAARIFTGASLPTAANAVIMQEHAHYNDHSVTFLKPIVANQNVRRQGEDVTKGSLLIAQGIKITALNIAQLASAGITNVKIFKPLTIGILSTGDELTPIGELLAEGKIYNSNYYLIEAILTGWGFKVVNLGSVKDDLPQTLALFKQIQTVQRVDVVISSGGVSVGDSDYLKQALTECGTIDFWKVAIKPGKPLAIGSFNSLNSKDEQANNMPFIGLPGNPQAALVSLLVLVRTFLFTLQGRVQVAVTPMYIASNFVINNHAARTNFLRVAVHSDNSNSVLHQHPNQSSGSISSAVWADGLAQINPHQTVNIGTPLAFYSFSQLLNG